MLSTSSMPERALQCWSGFRPEARANCQEAVSLPQLEADSSITSGAAVADDLSILSGLEAQSLKAFLIDLFKNSIVPSMENRLSVRHSQIVAAKKGFRNQLKMFFGRKPKSTSDSVVALQEAEAPLFERASIECRVREAADYAFVMQDYALALDNYLSRDENASLKLEKQ